MVSLLEPIITKLIEDGVFGDVAYIGLETDNTKKGAQFASDLTFVTLTVEGSIGKEVLPLVVKQMLTNTEVRKFRDFDAMMHNEVTMYKEILPVLVSGTNFYPRLYYGLATNGVEPEKDLLILENLKYRNFLPSKTKLFLDIDHIFVAIKKIAEFHSFSFILKHEDKENFLQMTKKLKSINIHPDLQHEVELSSAACLERGIKPLLKEGVSVSLLTECLSFLSHPIQTKDLITAPIEPFAVICHGDLCNNNILYKFDENDKVIDCAFLDFQDSSYKSPAIDIFFFLYLNTTSELREKYWDQILKLYWDTLRKYVPNHIFIPSCEDFFKHFAERAIYGYTISSFFLPIMMETNSIHENEKKAETTEEKIASLTCIGGDEAERMLIEIILHLLNMGYIQAFVELCKGKEKIKC